MSRKVRIAPDWNTLKEPLMRILMPYLIAAYNKARVDVGVMADEIIKLLDTHTTKE